MPYNLRPPRNTICVACYEGAKSIIAMTNKIDDHKVSGKYSNDPSTPNSSKVINKFSHGLLLYDNALENFNVVFINSNDKYNIKKLN